MNKHVLILHICLFLSNIDFKKNKASAFNCTHFKLEVSFSFFFKLTCYSVNQFIKFV